MNNKHSTKYEKTLWHTGVRYYLTYTTVTIFLQGVASHSTVTAKMTESYENKNDFKVEWMRIKDRPVHLFLFIFSRRNSDGFKPNLGNGWGYVCLPSNKNGPGLFYCRSQGHERDRIARSCSTRIYQKLATLVFFCPAHA